MAEYRISDCWTSGVDDAYCAFARDNFNYAVAETAMKWREYEPEFNVFDSLYTVDQMMDWLSFHNWGFRYKIYKMELVR